MRDKELESLLQRETARQRETLNLIASENFAPFSIRNIGSSYLANKYTEGYPGKRYYGGCGIFDEIESLAEKRASALWGANWANVQPHSGASANNAVFAALLQPGDKILGLALDHGGHLTHGMSINVSGTLYDPYFYHLRDRVSVDMEEVADIAQREEPALIIAGWSAYSDILDFEAFRQIADSVNAKLLVDMSHFAGLVAGEQYPNPVPWADIVTSTTHKTLRGPRGGIILSRDETLQEPVRRAVFPGQQSGAMPQTIAAKALAFHIASQPPWRDYARSVVQGAAALADGLQERGRDVLSARKTHQFLLDLDGASGMEAEEVLEENRIVCNRNAIPGEQRSPLDPSGIRLGSAALVSRGFREKDFLQVADWIDRALSGDKVAEEILLYLEDFPLP